MTAPNHEQLATEAANLEAHAALRERPDLAAVVVRGDDRLTWLNGQITNDVRQLEPGVSVHALAVNVKGKILAEVWVTDIGDALLMLVPERALTPLLESLERFIIMEDVTLERLDGAHVLSLEGPDADGLRAEIATDASVHGFRWSPLGLGGFAWVGPAAALRAIGAQLEPRAAFIAPAAYELARVRSGQPLFGVDFDEHQYPQEAGLKASVSFQKGCYLGQEVVCTLENRGRLNRHLCVLRSDSGAAVDGGTSLTLPATPGADALQPSAAESMGSVTSAVWDPTIHATRALGYVRRLQAKPGNTLLAGSHRMLIERLVGEHNAAPASA
jgi:folate-binding protein YgfZ